MCKILAQTLIIQDILKKKNDVHWISVRTIATDVIFFCVELVKLLRVHLYSIDIFTYSGTLWILGFDGKQNTS